MSESQIPAVTGGKRSKRHHYIPQFYQRLFLQSEDARIWVYDKKGGEPRDQYPVNTGVEKDLYTIPAQDGSPSDALETELFAILDGRASPILRRWSEPGTRMQQAEKAEIAVFLAYMHTRVPRNIAFVNELGDVMARELARSLPRRHGDLRAFWDEFRASRGDPDAHPEFEVMRPYLEDPERYSKITMNPKHALAFSLLATEAFIDSIRGMHWSLCDAASGSFFVTSDVPVVAFAPAPDGTVAMAGNLASPRLEVSFPLTTGTCLLLRRSPAQHRWRCGRELVQELNRRQAFMAARFLFSHLRFNYVQGLCEQFGYTLDLKKVDEEASLPYLRALIDRNVKTSRG